MTTGTSTWDANLASCSLTSCATKLSFGNTHALALGCHTFWWYRQTCSSLGIIQAAIISILYLHFNSSPLISCGWLLRVGSGSE